jgi:hypothetical protein
MGIQDHVQEVDRTKTIHISVWTRISGAIRIFGTHPMRRSNYHYVRKRHNIEEVKSTDGNGIKSDSGRISPRGIESKGQGLA